MKRWKLASRCRCGRPVRILRRWCEACARREADRIMAAFVKRRDGRCVVPGCKGGPLEWAHVQSRRYLRIRWNPDAAFALCTEHHRMFTGEPNEWRAFVEEIRPGLWDKLLVDRERPGRPDLAAIITTFGRRAA